MRVLALDLGTRRIGLAVSDEGGTFAFPAGVVERRGRRRDLDAVAEVARERGAARILVGLPLHLDGREGRGAEEARRFARDLAQRTGLPVDLFDERLTTRQAAAGLRELGVRPSRRRGDLDAASAAILLRTWLEAGGPERER